jgi:hypothetical protein
VTDLPIHAVLPDLLAALDVGPNAVLVAPPGAGKTTAVAPALLDRPWCTGRVILLSPRRIAARAAAERIAELAGEAVGGRIGYATRLDSRQSAATRLLVVTQGIFVSMVQSDPELAGISGVLFDEVHERSLDGDFGLALALDVQAALRPDLRLLAMSATLAGERFSALLGGAPLIESQGRSYPIDYRYLRPLGRADRGRHGRRHPPRARRDQRRRARFPARRRRDRAHRRADRRPAGRCRAPPPLRHARSGDPARRDPRRGAGQAQDRDRHRDRRDQPDDRRRHHRGRFRSRPPPALRSRRRHHPARDRAGEPGRGDPARRPCGPAGAGRRLSPVGGGGDRWARTLRSARNIRGRSVGAGAGLRDLGRDRSGNVALDGSAERRRGERGQTAPDELRADRR